MAASGADTKEMSRSSPDSGRRRPSSETSKSKHHNSRSRSRSREKKHKSGDKKHRRSRSRSKEARRRDSEKSSKSHSRLEDAHSHDERGRERLAEENGEERHRRKDKKSSRGRSYSRSRSRDRRHRSRSRDKRRSRSRSRDRRSKSREKKRRNRSRSRSKHRHRSRSRSKSRERKKRTEKARRKSRSRSPASPPAFRGRNTAMDAQEALARRLERAKKLQEQKEKELQDKNEQPPQKPEIVVPKPQPPVEEDDENEYNSHYSNKMWVKVFNWFSGAMQNNSNAVKGVAAASSKPPPLLCDAVAAAASAAAAAAAAAASNPMLNVAALLASGTQVTPQIAMAAQMAALQARTLAETGISVPNYYNPSAVNPMKFAEQEKKRKLLWKGKTEGDSKSQTAELWEKLNFGNKDQNVKFRKLMGIKGEEEAGASTSLNEEDLKTLQHQEEMFHNLDVQYEMARSQTHTQRGMGLGFGSAFSRGMDAL